MTSTIYGGRNFLRDRLIGESSRRARLGSIFLIAKWGFNLIVTLDPAKYVKRGRFYLSSCMTPVRSSALGKESQDRLGGVLMFAAGPKWTV